MTYRNISHIDELEAKWLDVQRRADCHYFLTWNWFGPWLKQVRQPFYLLQAYINSKVVGLAVIFEKNCKTLGISRKTQWWLNRTGNDSFDQPWLEYNDFLVDKKYKSELNHALLSFVSKQAKWNELVVGMITSETEYIFKEFMHNKRYIIKDYGYQINLEDINSSYKSEVLSRNTRQKVNQTERLLTQQGSLSFTVITSRKDKLSKFGIIGAFHINKWKNSETPSGFENPSFLNCFEEQIQSEHSQISELTLNDKPIAYLINYVYRDRVYFYLSALSNEFEGKIKLGLYIHSLTIEHYKEKKLTYYDFLAGKSRYKQSLSNSSYSHNMCCYYKNSLFSICEHILRKIKILFTILRLKLTHYKDYLSKHCKNNQNIQC